MIRPKPKKCSLVWCFYQISRYETFIHVWWNGRGKQHRNPVARSFHIEKLVPSAPFMAAVHGCQNVVTAVSNVSCNIVQLHYAVFFQFFFPKFYLSRNFPVEILKFAILGLECCHLPSVCSYCLSNTSYMWFLKFFPFF